MGKIYEWGYNPFRDFLFRSLMYNVDISSKELKNEITTSITQILENYLENKKDVIYLDYDIIKNNNNNYFKIKVNNSITALWFSGFFPLNVEDVLKYNKFTLDDKTYIFNKKTKNIKIINNTD